MKFQLGQVVVTPTASDALKASGQTPEEILSRHQAGDWGDVTDHERQINEQALAKQFSLLSIYRTSAGQRVSVVTKGDRSLTLIHIDPRPQ